MSELLLSISNELAVSSDLDQALDMLVHITTSEISAERGSVFLNDATTGELYTRGVEGRANREIRMLNSAGIAGWVFTNRHGVVVNDAYADERFNRSIDIETGFVTKSILCAPLRTLKGECIGAAQLLNKRNGEFTEDDLELLEIMIRQAAIAIESHLTVERIDRARRQELEFLGVVSEMSSELRLSALLQKLITTITKMLDAERSTLFINDEKRNELYTEVGQGLGSTQIRIPNDKGIAGAVFTSRNTINIPHAYADLRFNPSVDRRTGFFTRSILCVPVLNKNGKTIGVTQVLNKRGGPFTAADETLLKAFTSQIAIGLENAKLFDDVQNMKNYNDSILQSMSSGVITLNEDGEIITCNAAALRIMKVSDVSEVLRPASEFFGGENAWVLEKLDSIRKSGTADVTMDKEMVFAGAKVSVNITVLPLISTTSAKLGSMIMMEDISSEKRMKSTMARYMDPSLADRLVKAGEEILGGQSGIGTVLFCDIRSFTTVSEELGAQATVSLLNEYFTMMVDCIQMYGGMLDKFIGDALMAVFGTPVAHEDDEDRAVKAGILMLKELAGFNAVRNAEGRKPIQIGIGINTDTIVSGNIGSPKRMDYTVIGDGVNLASRLEAACKQYAAQILISENTLAKLRGTYRTREIDRVIVKGKTKPVAIFEVLDYHTEETFHSISAVLGHFRDGLNYYRRMRWDEAIKAFQHGLDIEPRDVPSQIYIDRCNYFKQSRPPDDWNGVWVMQHK
jgi:adenylate cyclase